MSISSTDDWVTIDQVRAMSDDEIDSLMPLSLAVAANRSLGVIRTGEESAKWKRRILEAAYNRP